MNCRIFDSDFQIISQMKFLNSLVIDRCPEVTPSALQYIPESLAHLELRRFNFPQHPNIDTLGYSPVKELSMKIHWNPYLVLNTYSLFLTLVELTRLKSLSVIKNNIQNSFLEALKPLVNLTSLDLSGNSLTDVNVILSPQLALENLDLSTNPITSQGIKSISLMISLKTLYLSETAIDTLDILVGWYWQCKSWKVGLTNLQILDVAKNSLNNIELLEKFISNIL